jgi:excisionase family DNA binding protein
MATEVEALLDRAQNVQRRLEAQGAAEDAQIVARLIHEVTAAQPKGPAARPYYTVSEAAEIVGVSGQTIKNWARRGLLDAFQLGGRIVIPRTELDAYRPLAEAAKGIEPLPRREEVQEAIRAGRRRFVWRVEPKAAEA